ncbi:glutathione S-transferase family protein [Taklimakanibacter deserti]|uniref:glutathione S-transferase family protein n=1 Tax=Taklimakanibacter deserti TaxID=2267839 RepID=UPI000E65181E
MKIYGDMISPYVRICFVAAHEAGLGGELELIATDVKVATENEELAALSPIAQIPVLVTPDGAVLHDSRVIVDHLNQACDQKLLARGGDERHRTLTLQAIGIGIADAAVAYRNEIAQRPERLHWHTWLDRQKLRVERALDALEARWQRELCQVNVGSITVAVALAYLDFRFDAWSWRNGRPSLTTFHQRFNTRSSMQATVLPGLDTTIYLRHQP